MHGKSVRVPKSRYSKMTEAPGKKIKGNIELGLMV